MRAPHRGRQLIGPADIARHTRDVLRGLDDGIITPTMAQAQLAALRLIFDVMKEIPQSDPIPALSGEN